MLSRTFWRNQGTPFNQKSRLESPSRTNSFANSISLLLFPRPWILGHPRIWVPSAGLGIRPDAKRRSLRRERAPLALLLARLKTNLPFMPSASPRSRELLLLQTHNPGIPRYPSTKHRFRKTKEFWGLDGGGPDTPAPSSLPLAAPLGLGRNISSSAPKRTPRWLRMSPGKVKLQKNKFS